MRKKVEFSVTEGQVFGQCPKCAEPFLGKFDCDGDDQAVTVECVNCHFKQLFKWTWPDDLPKFHLKKVSRHTKLWNKYMSTK